MPRNAKRRRGWGEGSIYQRPDGKWCGQISLGSRGGKRIRRAVVADTKTAVIDQIVKMKGMQANNTLSEPSKITVREYLEDWLENTAARSVRASTMVRYRSLMRHHVYDRIGHFPLQKLKPIHIKSILDGMINRRSNATPATSGGGVSSTTKSHALAVMRRAMQTAVKLQIIAVNPCDAVDRPKIQKTRIQPLDLEQSRRFLLQAKSSRFFLLYLIELLGGVRDGEARALRIPDVNISKRTITISRTLSRISYSKQVENEPKSERGKRQVILPSWCIDLIADLIRERMKADGANALLFPATGGGYLNTSAVRHEFNKILAAADLPRIRLHDLRHTQATLLLLSGEHPKVIQERLGHATFAMTMDIYGHVLPSMQAGASDKIDEMFRNYDNGNKNGNRTPEKCG